MYKILMKSSFIYIFILLFLLLIHAPGSFAGPPIPSPTPTSCSDSVCQDAIECVDGICDSPELNCIWCPGASEGEQCIFYEGICPPFDGSNCCLEHGGSGCDDSDCEDIVCSGDSYCCEETWDDICAVEAYEYCGDLCQGGTTTPPASTTRSFSQVGGIANSNPSDDWCCSFFANVCAPCGNPALGYSYQMPNACDSAIHYENLWVRCQDSDCSGLTTGSYEISLCHFDSLDPSSGGGETCGDPCIIDPSNNNCNADFGVGPVPEGEMVYIRIHPSNSPDAPLNGLWSALVEDCSGQAAESGSNCCIDSGGLGCDNSDCEDTICYGEADDPYCCENEWDDICAGEAYEFCGDLCK